MRLDQAIHAGVKFRRPTTGYWLSPTENLYLKPEDILATDWYLDEKAIDLRASQIREAFHAAFSEHYSGHVHMNEEILDLALQKLGLKFSDESADKE